MGKKFNLIYFIKKYDVSKSGQNLQNREFARKPVGLELESWKPLFLVVDK
jgi:hypothetical protein